MTSQSTRRDVHRHRRRGGDGRCGAVVGGKGATCIGSTEDGIRDQEAAVRPGEGERPVARSCCVSHYENNYTGAVKRLNAITAQLAALDFATAPVFVVNGLKREELIAANSMIIHELYFDSLAGEGEPAGALAEAIDRDFGSAGALEGRVRRPPARRWAAARAGCC